MALPSSSKGWMSRSQYYQPNKPVIIIVKTSEGVDIVCSNCWNEFLESLE